MAERIDAYGCSCEIQKHHKEFIIRMFNEADDCEVTLVSYVTIEELKSTIRLLEEDNVD